MTAASLVIALAGVVLGLMAVTFIAALVELGRLRRMTREIDENFLHRGGRRHGTD